jgi:hypothetical protein
MDEPKPRFLCWQASWGRSRDEAVNPSTTGGVYPGVSRQQMREERRVQSPCKVPEGYTTEMSQLVVLEPLPPVRHYRDSGKLAGTYVPRARLRWTGPVPADAMNRQLRIKTVFGQPVIAIFLGRELLTLEDLRIEPERFECTILRPKTDYFLSDSRFRFAPARKGGPDVFAEEYVSRMEQARGTIIWQELPTRS